MNSNTIRMIIGAGIVWYALTGGSLPGVSVPGVAPSGPYTGPLTALHDAAKSMDPKDRAALAEATTAAGDMLAADQLGLISTTEEMQRFCKAVLEFDYLGMGKPTTKYPAVAKAIQDELSKSIGTDVAPVTPAIRSTVAAALSEAGKALR
jgi:hypothetical protein